jgi:hypothetical protein
VLGTTSAASSWGRVIGPLMGGSNLALFGYSGAWLGAAVVVSLYLAWAFHAYGQWKRNPTTGDVHPGD